jgi:lactoylglutathione lyase
MTFTAQAEHLWRALRFTSMKKHDADLRTSCLIAGFRHTGITVENMDAALAFYQGLLGLRLMMDRVSDDGGKFVGVRGASIRICVLEVPGSNVGIELLEYRGADRTAVAGRPVDPGTGHLSFWVSDLDALYKRFVENGVELISEPIEAASSRKKFYARDPDGFWLELTAKPETSA